MNNAKLVIALGMFALSAQVAAQDQLTIKTMPEEGLVTDMDSTKAHAVQQFYENFGATTCVTHFIFGDRTMAFVDCRLDVFEYVNGEWQNHYRHQNHGASCGALFVMEGDRPRVFGGYGYWRGQSLNSYFDFSQQEWAAIPSHGTLPENYTPEMVYFNPTDSMYYVLYGRVVNEFVPEITPVNGGYTVDAEGNWTEVEVKLSGKTRTRSAYPNNYQLENDAYYVSIFQSFELAGVFIFDKRQNKVRFVERYVNFDGLQARMLDGDILTLYADVITRINLREIFDQGKPVTFVVQKDGRIVWALILGGVVIAVYFLSRGYRNQKIEKKQTQAPEYYWSIVHHPKDKYSTIDLDQAFGLENLSLEAIRAKRAKYVKEINEFHIALYGKPMLERTRNPLDKRQFIYIRRLAKNLGHADR